MAVRGIIEPEELKEFGTIECRRISEECEKYISQLSACGVEVFYGMVEISQDSVDVTGSAVGGKSITFPAENGPLRSEYIYLICFARDGHILYAKKDQLMFYTRDVVKSAVIETPKGPKTVYLFDSVMPQMVKYISEYCCSQVKKGEFSLSDQYLTIDLQQEVTGV